MLDILNTAILFCAFLIIFIPNSIYCLISFIVMLTLIFCLLILWQIELFAFIYLLIYIGAVSMLILFVIMLLNTESEEIFLFDSYSLINFLLIGALCHIFFDFYTEATVCENNLFNEVIDIPEYINYIKEEPILLELGLQSEVEAFSNLWFNYANI